MRRIIFTIVFLLFVSAFIVFTTNPNVTGAATAGQTKCLSPKAALVFINQKVCTRVYEDPKCAEQGKVEVRC